MNLQGVIGGDVFGLTTSELIIVFGVIAYVVSLLKDWRPVRALRQENHDLREALEMTEKRMEAAKADSDRKIENLERKVEELQSKTDLSPIAERQAHGIEVLAALVGEVKEMTKGLHANTAAVELLSKRLVIDDALRDDRHQSKGDPK